MENKDGIEHFLSAEDLARLSPLFIGSRFVVEGSLAGLHRSPLKGFSVEFADHRQYVPGDDLRSLDWRIFGRHERLYIRQYEEETNLRVYFLLDSSNSMSYASKNISKYAFACRCAAALAYIVIRRQDSAGLALFDKKCRLLLPARGGAEQLRIMCNYLAKQVPTEGSSIANSLHPLAEKIKKRSLIIILSDLFDDKEKLRSVLAHFRRNKHAVIVYHILDRQELEFSFTDPAIFQDLESLETLTTNPRQLRREYQNSVQEFLTDCKALCAELDVEYMLALSDEDLIQLILKHLHQRSIAAR